MFSNFFETIVCGKESFAGLLQWVSRKGVGIVFLARIHDEHSLSHITADHATANLRIAVSRGEVHVSKGYRLQAGMAISIEWPLEIL